MSTYRYSEKSAATILFTTTVIIIVDIAAGLFVIGGIFYLPYIPLWVRLLITAITLAIVVPTILYVLGRRRVVAGPVRDGSLERALIEVGPDALRLRSGAREFTYPWSEIASVRTNAEYYGGKADALVAQKALVLSSHPFEGKAARPVRRAIAKAALGSAWEPVEAGGMTVLPMRFLRGSFVELAQNAQAAHAKVAGSV